MFTPQLACGRERGASEQRLMFEVSKLATARLATRRVVGVVERVALEKR